MAAAASFGADAVSPVHGDPQGGTVTDPGYGRSPPERWCGPPTGRDGGDPVDRRRSGHDEALIDMGVDGIITDLPDRVRSVMAEHGFRLPRGYRPPRGGHR